MNDTIEKPYQYTHQEKIIISLNETARNLHKEADRLNELADQLKEVNFC